MRKLIIGIVVFFFVFTLYTCSDSFFNKEPFGTTAGSVFKNEQGLESLLLGSYGILSTSERGGHMTNFIWGSMASDDAYKGSELTDDAQLNYHEKWEVMTDHPYTQEKWQWAFDGINRVNEVLNILEEISDDLSETTKTRIKSEALFLRGLFNFEAWLVFKNIPIITQETQDPSSVTNDNYEGGVLEHIINDLEYAWLNLPETQKDVGRPTKYAAMALAARAYLQVLDYKSAKPLLDNIINSGKYLLMPNFLDNYKIDFNNNQESIFEIQYSVDRESGNAGPGGRRNYPHGGDLGMCCGFHQPSQNLVNSYRVDEDGLPMFDTFNDNDLKNDMGVPSAEVFTPFDDEVDPRLDWTVSRRGIPLMDWGINRGMDWIREQSNGGPYLPAGPKFLHWHKHHFTSETTVGLAGRLSTKNFRYLRYTHVLLWRAEVAAYDGDLDLALSYVNMIRERAGNEVLMGKVLIHKLPNAAYPWGNQTSHDDYLSSEITSVDWTQPAANYKIGTYSGFQDKAEAMRAVQWELRLEFALEGQRFFDLRRWDNLPLELNSMPMIKTLNDFAEKDLRIRTFMQGATFTERDKLQPIPQFQIDLQPGVLIQNPGY